MSYLLEDGAEHPNLEDAILDLIRSGNRYEYLSTEEALANLFSMLIKRGVLSLEDTSECLYKTIEEK